MKVQAINNNATTNHYNCKKQPIFTSLRIKLNPLEHGNIFTSKDLKNIHLLAVDENHTIIDTWALKKELPFNVLTVIKMIESPMEITHILGDMLSG